MPSEESLAISCGDVEWRYLVLRKAETLAIVQVIAQEECIEAVGIQSTYLVISQCSSRPQWHLQSLHRRRKQHTQEHGIHPYCAGNAICDPAHHW